LTGRGKTLIRRAALERIRLAAAVRREVMLSARSIFSRRSTAAVIAAAVATATPALATVTAVGDVTPVPPAGGGAVVGPFRIGNTGFG
jgi:hypothetical protein